MPNLAQYTLTACCMHYEDYKSSAPVTYRFPPPLYIRHYYHHYPSSFFAFWGGAHILKITFLAPCSQYFVLSVSLCPGKNAKKVGVCV